MVGAAHPQDYRLDRVAPSSIIDRWWFHKNHVQYLPTERLPRMANAKELQEIDLALAAQVAEEAACRAGALIQKAFKLPRQIERKGIIDLVTDTDKASEALIANILHNAFPTCNIVGEEGARYRSTSTATPFVWWIDPLDGTYNFVRGIPRFCVSMGCTDPAGNALVGVVYDPMFDECFRAVRGGGATCNGAPIGVSLTSQLQEALAASGSPPEPQTANDHTTVWSVFMSRCRAMAWMGSAALDLCYIASGRFDVYWEYGLAPWDVCAGVLIVREAGGLVTDYQGQSFDISRGGQLLASNSRLHSEALGILNPA